MNISLPREPEPNAYVTPDLCFRLHYFAIRKLHLLERAQAAVFFPGGFGTRDELFEVLTLLQTEKIKPLPVVLVGESYWRRAIDFDFMFAEGVISPSDMRLFVFRETAEDIWAAIVHWHETHDTRARTGQSTILPIDGHEWGEEQAHGRDLGRSRSVPAPLENASQDHRRAASSADRKMVDDRLHTPRRTRSPPHDRPFHRGAQMTR